MRVLHVASFRGNIGDQLNHLGFRKWFQELVGAKVTWDEVEIREVYRKNRNLFEWLSSKAEFADLIVFGGGNFWELWPENSVTGTSIDLSIDQLLSLGKPCFFNAIGIDAAQGVSFAGRSFPEYLSSLQSMDRFFVTARNDGANETLKQHFGLVDGVEILPDHGFFAMAEERRPANPDNVICLNLASDMPEFRFSDLSFERTLTGLTESLYGLEPKVKIKFVPHVIQDIRTALELVGRTADAMAREWTIFTGLDTTDSTAASKFSPYLSSKLNIVNRFHANVFCLAQGLPMLPIVNYPQIKLLLDGLPESWPFERLTPENIEYWPDITQQALRTAGSSEKVEYSRFIINGLRKQREEKGIHLGDWLRGRGLIS